MLNLIRTLLFSFRLEFIGGIIDAIGKNVKADIRMSREKSNQWQTSREDHLRNVDWGRQRLAGPEGRVADAKAAGIHPLFAIGSGGFSPTPTVSGAATYAQQNQARGSYGNVGGAIDAAIASKARTQRQSGADAEMQLNNSSTRRLQDSRSHLNELEAQRLVSDIYMGERDPWDTGSGRVPNSANTDFEPIGVGGPEARTFPIGTKLGRPLQARPLTMESRRSAPMREEVIGGDGERYQVISSKYDELAQADLPYQVAIRKLYRRLWATHNKREKANIKRDIAVRKAEHRAMRKAWQKRDRRYKVEQRTWRGRK